MIYAQCDSKDLKTAAVIKDNKVIAYDIRGNNILKEFTEIIYEKLQEKEKLKFNN